MKILYAAAFFLFVAPGARALEPTNADPLLVGQDVDHTDNVSVAVFRQGSAFTLRASCSGCILDIYGEDWLAADNPRARAPRDIHVEAWTTTDLGLPTDEVTFSLDEQVGVFASSIVVVLELETGFLIEKSVTLFGELDIDGKYTPIDWQTWACRSQKAKCLTEPDGTFVIILSEVVQ